MKPNYLFKTRRQTIARARRKYSIKDFSGAVAEWDELLERNAEDALAWLGRFDCLLKLDRKEEMLKIGDRVCELWPQSEAAHNNYACLLLETRQYEKACKHFDTALAIAPERNMYYFNAGLAYKGAGKWNEAAICFEHVLETEPEHQRALEFLSQLYLDFGLSEKLIELSMRLRMLRPGYTYPLQRRLFAMMNNPEISAQEINREVSLMRSAMINRTHSGGAKERVKVAWIICPYSLRFLQYVLPSLNRYRQDGEIEFVGFCNNPMIAPDQYQSLFDHVYITQSATLEAFTELLKANPVDVLVDSAGQMPNNLMQFYGARIAPLQISWPFYQSAVELALMDHAFVDEQIHPLVQQSAAPVAKNVVNLADRLVHAPNGQFFYDGDQSVALTPSPAETNGCITFGLVADPLQINQQSVDCFAEMMRKTRGSKLKYIHRLLPSVFIERSITKLFENSGIHEDRIEFEARSQHYDDRYACFSSFDILLSPFPMTDDMALMDAMWMGVPALAMSNSIIGHCRATSILTASEMGENLSTGEQEFVQRGISVAKDIDKLIAERQTMRNSLEKTPIMQTEECVEHFLAKILSLHRSTA